MQSVGKRDGIWDWDLATNRVHYSPRWVALIGAEDHEVCASPNEWILRVHPEDASLVARALDAARSGEAETFEFRHRLRHKDGFYLWVACRGVVQRDAAGTPMRLTGSHAGEADDTAADPITGLPSRRLLVERIARALERDSRYGHLPFAVLLLGLDRPGAATRPDGAIDRPLLTAVARRLETSLRSRHESSASWQNDLVAHLEQDCFAVLLEGLTAIADSTTIADRLLGEFRTPLTVGGRHVYVSASVGIAVSKTGYQSSDAMLRDAETALHRARVLGGGRAAIFDTAVLCSEEASTRLDDDMPGGLERNEFYVVYQPIVSLSLNRIVGFEALVRWRHPELGVIAPAEFIPAAERNGFIIPLGQWVMRQACAQLGTWRETIPAAADLSMSINVSSVQLKHARFVEDTIALVDACRVPARSVVLELTEGVVCENFVEVKTTLMQLRAAGLRVSIDDFGTGYSSLSYLQQFPVDALKIDRSFTRRLTMADESAAIVGTMTSMARQLGLHVVAEGVESEPQIRALRRLLCDAGQGYLFASPLEAAAAAQLLASDTPPWHDGGFEAGEAEIAPPQPERTRRGLSTRTRVGIAVAATVIVATAGLVSRFESRSSSVGGLRASAGSTERPHAQPPVAVRPLPANQGEAVRPETAPRAQTTPPPVTPPANTPRPSVSNSGEAAVRSFAVQHLHRFGSCRGRLVPSRAGLTFIPEETTSDDGFRLKHVEFLTSTDKDTLTIKTGAKTYRFKAHADARTAAERAAAFQALTEAVARFR